MAETAAALSAVQITLIEEARLFFVASAHPRLEPGPEGQGPVNCSPKGNVPLTVLDARTVAYLDYHGSGNETARHALADGPVTVMVMSLDAEDAAILRLYGRAEIQPLESSPLADRLLQRCRDRKGLRQVVLLHVESARMSCGYGVPVYEYRGDRERSQRGRRFK